MPVIIVSGISIIIMVVMILSVLKNYRRCPANKVLVISGMTPDGAMRCMHGSAIFIWPIFQEYDYLDLTPFTVDLSLDHVFTSQKTYIDISFTFTLAITADEHAVRAAATRLLGLEEEKIQRLAREMLSAQLPMVIAQMDREELNNQSEALKTEIYHIVHSALLEQLGIEVVCFNITKVCDRKRS